MTGTPGTMIVIDPELEPEPAPLANGGRKMGLRNKTRQERTEAIPSTASLSRFLKLAQGAVRLRGEVNVLLTSDLEIRRLNRTYRGKNKATDVLSFPAVDPVASGIAGDLAISLPTAQKQAAAQGNVLSAEIKILILHGLLHLAGYDHETDTGQMARRERLLRAKLRLPLGLIERAVERKSTGQSKVRA